MRERHEYVMQVRAGADRPQRQGAAPHPRDLPRDELFQSSEQELFDTAMGILGLQERVRSRCSCAATATAGSGRRWPTSRASA